MKANTMTPKLTASLAAVVLLGSAGCFEQAPAPCSVGRADAHGYAARYTVTSSSGACRPGLQGPNRIEQLYLNKYSSPDGSLNRVAILPGPFIIMVEGPEKPKPVPGRIDESNDPVAQGDFAEQFTPESGVCTVPAMSEARQDIVDPVTAATTVTRYQFSDLQFLGGAEYQGTSMGGSLAYMENDCRVEYQLSALWPGDVPCVEDADCTLENGVNDDYDMECLRYPDPAAAAGLCVMRKPFPSLK